ncbi:MAG: DUF3180 family protein [Dermatophilaceae bacterium]
MLTEGLRVRHLLTTLAAVTLVSGIVWHLYTRTGRMLQGPGLFTAVVLLVLAGLVLWAGWQVRTYQRGQARRALSALRAARILSLAQAGALTGAALAGWYLGHLAILLPDRDLTPYGRQVVPLLVVIGSGALLAVAGLLAQRWCRISDDGGPGGTGGPDGPDTAVQG